MNLRWEWRSLASSSGFGASTRTSSWDIKRVIGGGDLVATHAHLDLEPGDVDNPGRALADFFRLENGKAVEHWDVIQDVPTSPANRNGMF